MCAMWSPRVLRRSRAVSIIIVIINWIKCQAASNQHVMRWKQSNKIINKSLPKSRMHIHMTNRTGRCVHFRETEKPPSQFYCSPLRKADQTSNVHNESAGKISIVILLTLLLLLPLAYRLSPKKKPESGPKAIAIFAKITNDAKRNCFKSNACRVSFFHGWHRKHSAYFDDVDKVISVDTIIIHLMMMSFQLIY